VERNGNNLGSNSRAPLLN
jgi:hypothetical protein